MLDYGYGIDWAYKILVDVALAFKSKEMVLLKAQAFKPEVLDACVGMACADMEYHKNPHAYQVVRDVCIELTKTKKD